MAIRYRRTLNLSTRDKGLIEDIIIREERLPLSRLLFCRMYCSANGEESDFNKCQTSLRLLYILKGRRLPSRIVL